MAGQLHMTAYAQVTLLAHALVEGLARVATVVLNVRVGLEAKKDLDHVLVVVHDSEVEGCATWHVFKVLSRVVFE